MKILDPLVKIKREKQITEGMLIGFPIELGSFAYVIADPFGGLWLLDVRSEGCFVVPTGCPGSRAKWSASQGLDPFDREMWGLAIIDPLPKQLTEYTRIRKQYDPIKREDVWIVLGLMLYREATEEDFRTYHIDHSPKQIGVFAEEHFDELELINGQLGWTMVPPERFPKPKKERPRKPQPTGEHRIEVYVTDFRNMEIRGIIDLEEEIQEAIGEHGFVAGHGSLVGSDGAEKGDLLIECEKADVPAVLRAIRKVLKAAKAPADTSIVDVTMMDDGTEKTEEHRLGAE